MPQAKDRLVCTQLLCVGLKALQLNKRSLTNHLQLPTKMNHSKMSGDLAL